MERLGGTAEEGGKKKKERREKREKSSAGREKMKATVGIVKDFDKGRQIGGGRQEEVLSRL